MTLTQMTQAFMTKRRELLMAHTPLEGWVASISPKDEADLELETREPIGGSYIYGTLWTIDASVPSGEIHLRAGGSTHVVKP